MTTENKTTAAQAAAKLTPAAREQVTLMQPQEITWSYELGWPAMFISLSDAGLIRITGREMWGNKPQYRSVQTDFGAEVAAVLRATGAAS